MAGKKSEGMELVVREPSKELMAFSDKVAEVIGFNPIRDVFQVGNRVNAVAQLLALPEVDNILGKLEGSPAGFVTDKKDGEKYDAKTRAQAIQDCLSQGARIVGNEINIIRGKGMLVKNYYRRMIDILGHEGSPSEQCIYQMEHWYHKEVAKERGQGMITFSCNISGRWLNKSTGEVETFVYDTDVMVKFGGQYDTVDKAQGQVQRRAWKEFYERYSGVFTEDPELQHDEKAVEPSVTVGTTSDLGAALEGAEEAKVVEKNSELGNAATEPASTPPPQEEKSKAKSKTTSKPKQAKKPEPEPGPEPKGGSEPPPPTDTPPLMGKQEGSLF